MDQRDEKIKMLSEQLRAAEKRVFALSSQNEKLAKALDDALRALDSALGSDGGESR